MTGTYKDSYGNIGKHQTLEQRQDYSLFTVACQACNAVLFEFVHNVRKLTLESRILAIPDPNGWQQYGAESWYKPMVKVVCQGGDHWFYPVKDGEDRNQVCRSRGLTREQFLEWITQQELRPAQEYIQEAAK